jgi:hypothetical protein
MVGRWEGRMCRTVVGMRRMSVGNVNGCLKWERREVGDVRLRL